MDDAPVIDAWIYNRGVFWYAETAVAKVVRLTRREAEEAIPEATAAALASHDFVMVFRYSGGPDVAG